MDHPLLYEINTRCWLTDLNEGSGHRIHLGNIPESEFEQWVQLGFTHIWLMGVWTTSGPSVEQALRSRHLHKRYNEVLPDWQPEDVGGSPYAIGEYSVPIELGGPKGLAEIRRRLNERGIRLILDFVPNHLGLGHSWLQFWPELFIQGTPSSTQSFRSHAQGKDHWIAHGKDPYFPAWVDTAQLDFRLTETHQAVLDTLQQVADQCDGVRCDMAMLVLRDVFRETWKSHPCFDTECSKDFWPHSIASVKQRHPDFIFIAEAYWDLEQELLDQGFDYAYDKWFYDHLQRDNGAESVAHLRNRQNDLTAHGVHFLENHDEPRAAKSFNLREHRGAAVLACCLPGMRLLHEGQLSGAEIQIPVQLVRRPREERNDDLYAFYTWLLHLLRATSIGHGVYRILIPTPAWGTNETAKNIFTIQWQKEPGQFEIVAANPTDDDAQCMLRPEIPELANHNWDVKDLLSAVSFKRKGTELRDEGLYLAFTPRSAHIYHFSTND